DICATGLTEDASTDLPSTRIPDDAEWHTGCDVGSQMRGSLRKAVLSAAGAACLSAAPAQAALLDDVRGVLAASRSPIAANTLRAWRSGALLVDTLDHLTVDDCRQLVSENEQQWQGRVETDDCRPGAVPAAILDRVSG